MDIAFKQHFMTQWEKYFAGAELPLALYYTNDPSQAEVLPDVNGWRCVIADVNKARRGNPIALKSSSVGCPGGRKYCGFSTHIREGFEYFLSSGIPGKLEGERYKKTPELVKNLLAKWPEFIAPGEYIVFKRWDALTESDTPEVMVFFASPDVLSGLFTLAGFDVDETSAVTVPFAAGCASIAQFPYQQRGREDEKCVIGMLDVSARPYVESGIMTFAAGYEKFVTMTANMDESFLITPSWDKIAKRIAKNPGCA